MRKLITLYISVLLGSVIADSNLDLWNAVQAGNLAQVEEALASGADPEWVNPDPVVSEANPKWMYEDDWTPLHWASYNNDPTIVSALLEKGYSGYDVNIRSRGRYTPLLLASRYGHIDIVNLLIERGASINWQSLGWTALHYAAHGNYLENADYITIMYALLDAGADTDAELNGRTPIMLASEYGNIDSVNILINRGANLDMQTWNGEETALMIAIEKGFLNVAKALIDANVNLELVNEYGLTNLHIAAKYNQPKIAQLLLHKGANPNQQDNWGRTPRDIAIEEGINEGLDRFSVIIDRDLDLRNEAIAVEEEPEWAVEEEPEWVNPMDNFVPAVRATPAARTNKKQSSTYGLYVVGSGVIISMATSLFFVFN